MVGHIPVDLRNNRTLNTVYLDPMLKILEERNSGRQPNETWIGLLEDDPSAEIQIVIDFVRSSCLTKPLLMFSRNRTVLPCGRTCFKRSNLFYKRDM